MAVMALFVSSVSACVCSHHQTKPKEEKASCHSHGETGEKPQTVAGTPLVSEGGCYCLQPTPRAVSKAGKFSFDGKILKADYFSIDEPVYFSTALATVEVFSRTDYLSKTVDRLSAPRAPPRL